MPLHDLLLVWLGSFGTLLILSLCWLSGLLSDEEACVVERVKEGDSDGN